MRVVTIGGITCASLGLLTACSVTEGAMITGSYDAMFANLNGHGTMMQRPDGKQGFRFGIAADAYKGIVDGDHEVLRKEALQRWLGKHQHCPRGYVVDNRTEITQTDQAVIYEGHCT